MEHDLEHGTLCLEPVHRDCMADHVPMFVHVARKFDGHLAVVVAGLVLVAGRTHTVAEVVPLVVH